MRNYVNDKNRLFTKCPHLISQWHPKNAIQPHEVAFGSTKKHWWICDNGHEWEDTCAHRAIRNDGCPYCSNHRVCDDNCLEKIYPELAKEWHPTKNGIHTPSNVIAGTHKKHWWVCSKGHEWETCSSNRTFHNKGCPYCSNVKLCFDNSFANLYPELAKEWNSTKNKIEPSDVLAGSKTSYWWTCQKGHEWKATCDKRIRGGRQKVGTGCPFCRESLGEKRIVEVCKKHKVSFQRQVRFDTCRMKLPLPFDFMINNVLIEYHGEQHYKPIQFGKMKKEQAEKELLNRVKLDKIKENWCFQNKMNLCIIPYWSYTEIEEILLPYLPNLS